MFKKYISELHKKYKTGEAAERSYYTPLENLLKEFKDSQVLIEARNSSVGIPDLKVETPKNLLVGYIEAIRQLIKITIDEELEEKLNEKLKYFPSKEDFFSEMDKIMGELKTIREEGTVLSHQVSGHEDKITILEEKAGIQAA